MTKCIDINIIQAFNLHDSSTILLNFPLHFLIFPIVFLPDLSQYKLSNALSGWIENFFFNLDI